MAAVASDKSQYKSKKSEESKKKHIKVYKKKEGECFACIENKTLVNISPNCQHNPEYCSKCISKYLHSKISTKGARKFQCLHPSCNVTWDTTEYYQMLDDKHLKIVDKLNLNATLEQMEDFRWCKNPKGCGSGQLVFNYKDLKGIDAYFIICLYMTVNNLFTFVDVLIS